MLNLNAALTLVDKFLGLRSLVSSNQNVSNIVDAVLLVDKQNYQQTKRLAKYFQGRTITETAENIWKFLKLNIKYQADNADQFIKSPSALLHTNIGDCKSFSVFTGSILKNLNIPYTYRFVGFDGKNISHVFVVVIDGNGQEIIIDAVWSQFNSTQNYNISKNYNMSVYKVTGFDEATKKVYVPEIAKDYAKLMLAGSNAIESKGSTKTVILTVSEVDSILQKAQNLKETVSGFNPFKWIKNQVQAVRTTLKDILGDKAGDAVFFGLIGTIGGGGVGAGIGILLGLGQSKITSFDANGFQVKLTDQEITSLQNPDENSQDYKNVILKLAGQFSALAYLCSSVIAKERYLSNISKSSKTSITTNSAARKINGVADYKLDPKPEEKSWINKAWNWATDWIFGKEKSEWSKAPEAVKRVIINYLIWQAIFIKRLDLYNSNDPLFFIFDFIKNQGWLKEDPNITVLSFFQKNEWAFKLVYWAYGMQDANKQTRNAATLSFVTAYLSQQGSTSAAPDPEGYDPEFYPTKKYYNTSENNTISSATKNLLATYNVPITNDMTVAQAVLALKTAGVNVPASVVDDESLRQWLVANPGNGGNGGNGGNNAGNEKKGSLILPISLIALLLN